LKARVCQRIRSVTNAMIAEAGSSGRMECGTDDRSHLRYRVGKELEGYWRGRGGLAVERLRRFGFDNRRFAKELDPLR